MNKVFNGLEYARAYIDDLLIISNKSFQDYINKLDKVLSKLNQKSFKVNAQMCLFARNELEYLGLRITRQGIKNDKVEAIKSIAVPTTKNYLRSFIQLINYYKYIWQQRSEMLTL